MDREPAEYDALAVRNTALQREGGPTLSHVSRRAWLIALTSSALVAAGSFAYARARGDCGASVTSLPAARSSSPFLDADQRAARPDHDRDTVVAALDRAPAPFGEVLGAVGYHYDQWAGLSAFAQGIGVRTRDNPDFTMLDDTTADPLWSVRVDTRRSAYDASSERYLVATMPARSAPTLVALEATTGRRRWCHALGGSPVSASDPFATLFLASGGPGTADLAVLTTGAGRRERMVRLAGSDGSQRWERTLETGSGDFLGDLGEGTLLAGGREQSRLFDPTSMAERAAGTALVLVSAKDGSTIWTRRAAAGSDVHVLGTDPTSGTALLEEWDTATGQARLLAIDRTGAQLWEVSPTEGAGFDAAVREGRILVRSADRWSAYDAGTGRRLWSRTMPNRPQFLPYGFQLDGVATLDADHVLVAGTTALHVLDLRTGAMTSAPLPTDGISTTYWPYQVAVSPGLVAVATNTGAVVVRRE